MSLFRNILIDKALNSDPYLNMPLTIQTLEENNTIKLNQKNLCNLNLFYKINDGQWISMLNNANQLLPITLENIGDKIQFKNLSMTFSNDSNYEYYYFSSTANFKVYGNIMSLVQGNRNLKDLKTIENNYQFSNLFYGCTKLISAQNLKLPATTLSDYCYSFMLCDCCRLINQPEIPLNSNQYIIVTRPYEYFFGTIRESYTLNSLTLKININQLQLCKWISMGNTNIKTFYLPNLSKSEVTANRLSLHFNQTQDNTVYCSDGVLYNVSFSCFIAGTKIMLSNMTQKNIEDITYQDQLLVWNFDEGKLDVAKPAWIKIQEQANYYYESKLQNGITIKTTGKLGTAHECFSYDRQQFDYFNSVVNQNIYTLNGISKLASCQYKEQKAKYYNIITKKHFNLFANGILTSCSLNKLYPIKNMKFVKDQIVDNSEIYKELDQQLSIDLRLSQLKQNKLQYVNNMIKLMKKK